MLFSTLSPSVMALGATAIVLLVITSAIAARKGRKVVSALVILLALSTILCANIRIPIGAHEGEQLFIIDASASNFESLDEEELTTKIRQLAAFGQGDVRVVVANREVVDTYTFSHAQATSGGEDFKIELPRFVYEQGDALGFAPNLALSGTPVERAFIFSDGDFEVGDVLPGVDRERIVLVEPTSRFRDLLRITGLKAPDQIQPDEGAKVELELVADSARRARLTLAVSGQGVILDEEIELSARPTRKTITILPKQLPSNRREIDIIANLTAIDVIEDRMDSNALSDPASDNNYRAHRLRIAGKPRALLVSSLVNGGIGPIGRMLREGGWAITLKGTEVLSDAKAIQGYDLVLLDDIRAEEISDEGKAIQEALKHQGLRLVVSGARNAWGPGGYQATAFERLLPLDANPKNNLTRFHGVLIDASASMGEQFQGVTRMDWLRQAAQAYLEALDEEDRFALIPFNAGLLNRHSVFERGAPVEKARAREELVKIHPASQTAIIPSLKSALEQVIAARGDKDRTPAFVTLLSDGVDSGKTDSIIIELAQAEGVTIRVFVIGDQKPAWLKGLEAIDANYVKAGQAPSLETHMSGDFAKLASTIRRERGKRDGELLRTEPAQAGVNASEALTMKVGPWVETARKPGTASRAYSWIHYEKDRFPLAAEWPYLSGKVLGITTSLIARDSHFSNDAATQKHILGLIQDFTSNEIAGQFQARWSEKENRIIVQSLQADISSRALKVRGELALVEAADTQAITFTRESADGLFISQELSTREATSLALIIEEEGIAKRSQVTLQSTPHREVMGPFNPFAKAHDEANHVGIQVLPATTSDLGEVADVIESKGVALAYLLLPLAILLLGLAIALRSREGAPAS